MTRLLIVGPPGAGKGTQATQIAAAYAVPAISTGDIFRSNVSEGTDLGVQAKAYMDAGEYVPDSLTNALVRDRLSQSDAARGFLLDGYPRTLDQVQFLDSVLTEQGASLDAVIQLGVESDIVVERLLKRAQEQGRSDDTEPVIRHRMDVYTAQTAPLIDEYEARGLVVTVDGIGSVDEVSARIAAALKAKLAQS